MLPIISIVQLEKISIDMKIYAPIRVPPFFTWGTGYVYSWISCRSSAGALIAAPCTDIGRGLLSSDKHRRTGALFYALIVYYSRCGFDMICRGCFGAVLLCSFFVKQYYCYICSGTIAAGHRGSAALLNAVCILFFLYSGVNRITAHMGIISVCL